MKLEDFPLEQELPKDVDYWDELSRLQRELLAIQQAYHRQERRAIIVFEGWDAGGKGGNIRRMSARLDPRGLQVHSIGAPDPVEQATHYLVRFWRRLPKPGCWAVFDRSWYGRLLVERVEGFAIEAAWRRGFDEINQFEEMLVDDGVRLLKIFLHVSAEEQLLRFKKRFEHPLKRWKLTTEDFRNFKRRDAYHAALNDVFAHCHTDLAPWKIFGANNKRATRISVLSYLVDVLSAGVDTDPPGPSAEVQKLAKSHF